MKTILTIALQTKSCNGTFSALPDSIDVTGSVPLCHKQKQVRNTAKRQPLGDMINCAFNVVNSQSCNSDDCDSQQIENVHKVRSAHITAHIVYDSLEVTWPEIKDKRIIEFMTRVAFGAIKCGLVSLDGEDYMTRAKADEQTIMQEHSDIVRKITSEFVDKALYVCVAMKVNFWKTNHHMGSLTRKLNAYLKNIVKSKLFLTDEEVDGPEWISAVHTASHWLSTRVVLDTLGIQNIQSVNPLFDAGEDQFKPDIDMQRSVKVLPVGTLRHETVVAMTNQLRLQNKLKAFAISHKAPTPCSNDVKTIRENLDRVKSSPAFYHTGCIYLTGEKREFTDSDANKVLNHLSVFLEKCISSPEFANEFQVINMKKIHEDYKAKLAEIKRPKKQKRASKRTHDEEDIPPNQKKFKRLR